MSNYTKKALQGASIVLVVSMLAAVAGYAVRFILARNLTVEEFGLFYSVFAFLSLIGVFKTMGLNRSLIKFIPEFVHKKQYEKLKSSLFFVSVVQFVTNCVVLIALYMLSSYLAVHYFKAPQADFVLKIMTIAFFIDNFILVIKFSMQGFQKMNYFSGIDLVRMLLIIGIVLVGFQLGYGLVGVIVAYIIAPIVILLLFGTVFVTVIFPQFFSVGAKFDMKLFRKLFRYSIFVMATAIGMVILGYTDIVLLTYFSGLTAVALYSVALPTAKIFLYFPRAIAGILLPLTSELLVKKKKGLVKEGYELLYKYVIIMMLPLAITAILFSSLIIEVLFGSSFIDASLTLQILCFGMIFASLYVININYFSALGKPEVNSMIIYSAAVFNFIANIIVIPLYGIVGAAVTTAVSYFIMMAVGSYKIRKMSSIEFPVFNWVKTVVAGVVFAGVTIFLKGLITLPLLVEAVVVVSLAGVVYFALLLVSRTVTINELKMVYSRVRK